jgi:site-specific DNA recombinase
MTHRTEVPDVPAQTHQAVIHARVSSKEQEKEGFSIPAQLKLLRGYANYHGFDIVREFVDVETAKQPGRPGFAEMVKFLKRSRTCRVVLVEDRPPLPEPQGLGNRR